MQKERFNKWSKYRALFIARAPVARLMSTVCIVMSFCTVSFAWNHKCKDEIHQGDEQEIGIERQKTANKKSSRI